MAFSLNNLNILGFGFPSCANGVIVTTSIKPNPNAPNESIKSPFLSKPAAIPSLFLNTRSLSLY